MTMRMLLCVAVVVALGVGIAAGLIVHQPPSLPASPPPIAAPPTSVTNGEVIVPDVAAKPFSKATELLQRTGLAVVVTSGGVVTSSGNRVLAQRPAAGATVARGATVRLYIP